MHLVYLTSIYKWDIHDSYSYTRPVRVLYNSYESALALRVLFYFLRSLYLCSSPYSTRGTHYRLIEYITFGVLLCVTHSDHLAVPTKGVVISFVFRGHILHAMSFAGYVTLQLYINPLRELRSLIIIILLQLYPQQ